MPDTYSTDALLGVVDGLKVAVPALLQRYFPVIEAQDTEFINFDILSKTRRIAPFVHPLVAGKIVANAGYQTKSFKPAYIKDKRQFNAYKSLQRAAGEPIGGNLSPQQRADINMARAMADQVDMINRRLEVMASEALRTGKVTVTGDEYPTVVVDFTRDAALSPAALTGTDAWDDAASTPLDDIRLYSLTMLQKSGVAGSDVIMGTGAVSAFMAHASVKGRLDNRNITQNLMNSSAVFSEGLTPLGTIDGFGIWTYGGWYVDPADDTEKEIFPAKQIALASPGIEGVQAFGAIQDPRAGFAAVPYFPSTWIDNDPPVQWLMMQSAPLTVPTRVNASLGATVLE